MKNKSGLGVVKCKKCGKEIITMLPMVFEFRKESKMTKGQIEKFAVGYPYPTDWVEKILVYCNFNIRKAEEILLDDEQTKRIIQTN